MFSDCYLNHKGAARVIAAQMTADLNRFCSVFLYFSAQALSDNSLGFVWRIARQWQESRRPESRII
jgi:hypothetical protein